MHRIDTSTAVDGNFVDKNPTLGVEGTVVDADWLNAVQDEICNVITSSGASLNKNSFVQLVTAIDTISKNAIAKQLVDGHSIQDAVSTGVFRISDFFTLGPGFFIDESFYLKINSTDGTGNAVFTLRKTGEANAIATIKTVDLSYASVNELRYLNKMPSSTTFADNYYFAIEFTGNESSDYSFDIEGIISKN
ncbi:MAG: hypothetical protein J6Q25_08520 [Bacteroidales bacterium]|nr:hypothetical protein [Bacteroidales bacterium]